jgi:hypothetical protein
MKVEETSGLILNPTQQKKSLRQGEGKDFRQVMDEVVMEKGAQGCGTNRFHAGVIPEGVQIINQSIPAQPSQAGSDKERVLKELDQTLDLVDFYAQKLSDRSFPIRDMEGMVSHLEERMEGLRKLQSASELPDQLKSVVSDTLLTIATETAKFRRGDYL